MCFVLQTRMHIYATHTDTDTLTIAPGMFRVPPFVTITLVIKVRAVSEAR